MNTKGISVAIGANLQPIQRDFNQALSLGDRFQRNLSAKLNGLDAGKAVAKIDDIAKALGRLDAGRPLALPSPESAGAVGAGGAEGASQAQELAGAIMPLAATIGTSLQKAMAPMASFAARFGAQFEKVGATVVTLARRIDDHMKFPRFEAWINAARRDVQILASNSEGRFATMASRVDKALAGIRVFSQLKSMVVQFGDVSKKTMGDVAKLKAPNVNFSSSTNSITNFYGATKMATGGLKAFAGQAALALGIFGLGFKAIEWIKDGVKGAMDLGETMSATKEIFGSNTDAIAAQADEMAAKFGIVKKVSLEASISFGTIAKASGLSGDAAADLSNRFTKLAADVSSMRNIPIDEALEKMRAGLVGEAEPMRSIGVLLSEGAVQAEAWRSGIAKAGAELTDQQKVQARAALITKGLAYASGDLERTQDSASNQARKFAGSMTNLAVDVGGVLLPALQSGLGLLNQFGSFVGRTFAENKATFESWGASVSEAFALVGDVFKNLPLVFEIGRLTIVQGLLNLGEQFEVLGPNVVRVAQWIGDNWYQLIRDAVNASLTVLKNFGSNVTSLGSAIGTFLADPTQGFQVNWSPLLDGFKSTVSELPALLRPKLTDMSNEINAAKGKFGDVVAGRRSADAARSAMAGSGGKGTLAPEMGEPQSIKDLKDQASFVKKLKDDLKTPAQKLTEGMLNLHRAHNAGQLSDQEFERGKAQVRKDAGINNDVKFSGAMVEGSKDAYSSVLSAVTGRGTDLAKSSAMTAANTAKIAANTKSSGAGSKPARKVANFA